MTILAIDTATKSMALAIANSERVFFESVWQSENYHTVELAPAVEYALRQAHVKKRDITAIALAKGPGSYTGLRIGMALAKGMAFSMNIPIVPVPTLDILAAGIPVRDIPLIALIQAGRGRYSAAGYKALEGGWALKEEAQLTTIEALYESISAPTIVCGELIAADRKKLGRKKTNIELAAPALCMRRPTLLAQIADHFLRDNQEFSLLGLAPDYLQSDAALAA